ncbi:antA/AntB antirepressor family protein [Bartonella massiliensis]|uniref:antA/AntB antirepressor family protein n=1 Tax=Bartonella massiliensis TaxID=929795 RepID=UPI00115B964B|nr:antA/AntB antirepressor family protein [Bartonella massiliensis]
MNNPLIEIKEQTIDKEIVQTVNARDLHAFLEIKSEFRNWIKNRIKECKFRENIDFVTAVNFYRGAQMKEYHITLDMAKHLSMIERNDKGHEARAYFIECEKRAKQVAKPQIVVQQIDYSSPQAMIGFLHYLQGQIDQKDSIIENLTPKAMALESLQRSDGLFGLTEAAKVLEIKPKQFIQFLQQKGWVYRRTFGANLLPYQDKIQKGLMDCSTHTIQTTAGIEKVIPAAKITTKGMGVLSEELKRQNMH